MVDTQRFADLRYPRAVWAVAAIHGEVERLAGLHDELYGRFMPGERLVYLGNFLGRGNGSVAAVEELLEFRRALLAVPGLLADDIVYLRGGQEEMWQKLLQLQFAPNPSQVLEWMLRQGAESTLNAYGGRPDQARAAARDGVVSLTRWTNGLRSAIRSHPGHETLMSALRRAAYAGSPATEASSSASAEQQPGGVLLVSAGIDPTRPFGAQGDSFWWGGAAFGRIDRPYAGFRRVVRGYDPSHGGVQITDHTVSLDGGCGFGGKLVCARLSPDGDLVDLIEI